jgi:integrase
MFDFQSSHSRPRNLSMKLTAKTIDAVKLPAGKSEHVEFDDEIAGFFLRIRAGGSRTLGYQYKIGKQNRRLTLGPAVKEAFPGIRQRVLDLVAQVRLGKDPAAEKEAARQPAAETFEKIARRFLVEQGKKLKPRSLVETERYLLVVAKPLHSKPVAEITKRNIAELLSTAAAERGDVTANRLRSTLSAMFVWSLKEGLCESNPVTDTNKRDEISRNRTLVVVDPETHETDMSQLVAVWNAVEGMSCAAPVRLLILTGQRRDEIGALRWSELDEGMTRITLSPERQKNGGGKERLDHIIPLSEHARAILANRPHIVGWPCVFSSSDRGYGSWDQEKKKIDAKLSDFKPWVIHDLRRSVSTGLNAIGIQPHIVEAVLNHISGHKSGVGGIYNKYPYEKEKRQALVMWAEHLMAAVSGKSAKVVPLRA